MNTTDNTSGDKPANSRLDLRQLIKILVYALLLINWGLYFADDLEIARHTLHNGGSFLEWTEAFATSIDELAWFALLFLFELETSLLSDESFTRGRVILMHGIRIICYAFLAHTLFAFANIAIDLNQVKTVEGVDKLCDLTDRDLSYASNLEYTVITPETCSSLSSATEFYFIDDDLVVTDKAGLAIERELAWVDLAEAGVWLVILFFIEVMVRLQDRGVTRGPLMQFSRFAKMGLYCLLWAAAAYWIYRGHWMFAWDEALWILGFMAIGMNLSEWKKEIEESHDDSLPARNSP